MLSFDEKKSRSEHDIDTGYIKQPLIIKFLKNQVNNNIKINKFIFNFRYINLF